MTGVLRLFVRPPLRWWACAAAALLVLNIGGYAFVAGPALTAVEEEERAWAKARADLTRRLIERRAEADVERFRVTLLERKEFAQLVVRVTELARGHGLVLPAVNYAIQDLKEAALAKVSMAFAVSGEYDAFRRFLSDVERAREFLTIEELSLTKAKGGGLSVQVKAAAHLRRSSPRQRGDGSGEGSGSG